MFNYIELEKDDRKKIIKYVNEKKYKKAERHISPPVAALTSAFGKPELSRVDYSTMRSYVYKNCVYPNNEIIKFYDILVERKMSDNIDFHSKLADLINDRTYSELDDETKAKIEEYRSEFDELEIPFGYDVYIRFLCVPEESSIEKLKEDTVDQLVKEMQSKLDESQNEYNKLAKNFNEQVKQIRNQNNEIARLKSEKDKYEKLLSISNITEKLSDVLPEGFKAETYKEVYEKLNELEKDCYLKKEFDKCKRLLSAEYVVIKIINHKE